MPNGASESAVMAAERLRAAAASERLFRNNSGVLPDRNGRPVRFGLGNESEAINQRFKSPDLVGWRPLLVTPDLVGHVIAQTVGRECKPEGWKLTPGDKRGQAQARWGQMLLDDGGDFAFVTTLWEGMTRG